MTVVPKCLMTVVPKCSLIILSSPFRAVRILNGHFLRKKITTNTYLLRVEAIRQLNLIPYSKGLLIVLILLRMIRRT